MKYEDYVKGMKRSDPNILDITVDDMLPRDNSLVDAIMENKLGIKISKTHLRLHDMADNGLKQMGLYYVTRKSFRMRRFKNKHTKSVCK